MNDDKIVRITMRDGLPVPDLDPIPVKKGAQRIKWQADFDFQIDVDGYNDVRRGNGGDAPFHVTSGVFNAEKRYKYSISANGVVNDPDIDVKP
ncbi:MAG TPA: hypothetical protein VF824_12125 [Thermoanaerobaculia bacterium]|jgi:hypothetical protein